jgi:hypothetical protein
MLDGTTRGIAVTALGSLSAAFYAREAGAETAPQLLFDLE